MPELGSTGVTEVDQLTSAISSLNQDIASVRQLEQQRIEHDRDFDMLTGLMNRRAFHRECDAVFSSPERLKNAAVVMLDIDNLKDINDAYGHEWGDKYVHAAARCFEDAVPPDVLVARVSGDEFYLLFYGYDTKTALQAHIEHLRSSLEGSLFIFPDGKRAAINASGGVAVYLDDADDLADLMRLADFTMYQVKAAGKNNIAYFDLETYQRETTAMQATAELDKLLGDYRLAHYSFQPIFDAHTGKPFAYEALMRVSMDVLQSPIDVLVYARQEGRLQEVERLTWTRAFECYRDVLRGGQASDSAYLFLNTFSNVGLDQDEMDAFALANQDIMGKLVMEMTEADTMDEDITARKRDMPGFGGLFALDDYGSGYNSEIMLLRLKPKFVKVDISIVRDIDSSVDKRRMVSQIVEYAHERDMLIVAEGVETAEELDTVLSLGVDLLQGFFLARPAEVPAAMSPEALQHLLAAIDPD